ncbi:hypothetical protein [Flammeovirga sp. SJP92]|uniref:hypothetical protein n=1 Tax=Flammeovirga sp. SJP92 TaxID=1775430 RepID=UPI0012F880C6|nr:hypothetical protein [Flammeovirga sp. SJP92]
MKTKLTEKSLRPSVLEVLQSNIKSRVHDDFKGKQRPLHEKFAKKEAFNYPKTSSVA